MNQDIAQKLLNELCRIKGIPRIEVIVKIDMAASIGEFDVVTGKYQIVLRNDADFDTLYHEFIHYRIHLFSAAASDEEDLCDEDMNGFKKTIKDYPRLKHLLSEL